MRQDILDYAEKMAQVRDLFINTSAKVPVFEPDCIKSIAEVESYRKRVRECHAEYERICILTATMSYPQEISEEHKRMVEAFGKMVEGLRMMEQTLTINSDSIDFHIDYDGLLRGNAIQNNASKVVGVTVGAINLKFEKLLR